MLYKGMGVLVVSAFLVVLSSQAYSQAASPPIVANTAPVVSTPGGIQSTDDLVTIFRNAAMTVTKDAASGEVTVEESSFKVIVRLDEPKKLITYTLLFVMEEAASTEERLQLANKLNFEVVLARFYVGPSGHLFADYALSYEDGISPAQVVRGFRWIFATVTGGIQTHDTKKIVK